jgi:hypothetical protein
MEIIYDVSNDYSRHTRIWWANNKCEPSTYALPKFSVDKKVWEKFKKKITKEVLSTHLDIKKKIEDPYKPSHYWLVTNMGMGKMDNVLHISEKSVNSTQVSITDFELSYSEETFRISEFHDMCRELNINSENKSCINMIINEGNGLDVRSFDITIPEVDIRMNYGDEWAERHEKLIEALTIKPKKGIALLHGLPGTGKSMYIRHLISILSRYDDRTVIYLPNQMIDFLTDPSFIPLMTSYANSILVIEDADEAIQSRKNGGRTVDKLLNISDGILSDFLGIQIICTFNCDITMIDDALLRKGRLILKHEFGKLSKEKAQELSNHLGFDTEIKTDMTLAEIYNQDQTDIGSEPIEKPKIGFGFTPTTRSSPSNYGRIRKL